MRVASFGIKTLRIRPRFTVVSVCVLAGCLLGGLAAVASTPNHGHGVLVHLNPKAVARFDARHSTHATRLNPHRDLYLVTTTDRRTDQDLLDEIRTDPDAGRATLNSTVKLNADQSTASVLNINEDQSTASVLNQSTASVLNTTTVDYYGTRAPALYVSQPMVGQIQAGAPAHARATGRGVVVALIDNGVDPFNPVLRHAMLRRGGYNFFDGTGNWSAYADLAQSTASVLNGDQSTASVLNDDPSTASVLNGTACTAQTSAWLLNAQSTASVLNDDPSTASVLNDDQSTASVLNDQSTASVLNDDQSTASVLNALAKILACNPDFGHGTSVAGLIHLIAPEAKILPIKAFGPSSMADASVIYQSLTYAIDQHVDVINLSFSSADTTDDIRDAIQEAVRDGIVVAAAAGNSDASTAVYPASLPGVLGVGAVDGTGINPLFERASFSNFDPGTGIVDDGVAAPGVKLFTTYPGFGRIWATVSGTSFSAPLVAGEAALLVELDQTGAQNRSDIEGSSDPAIAGDLHGELGHGMIQVLGALQSAPTGHGGDPGSGHRHRR